MDSDDCVLVGTDVKAGTQPMYVVSFKNKVFGYIISTILFSFLLIIIFYKSNSMIIINTIINFNVFKIPIFTLLLFIISIILFYIGNASRPNELFFGILGIIFSVVLFIFYIIK